jgi:hypothetical protein
MSLASPAAHLTSEVAPVRFTPDDDFYDHPQAWDLPDCAVALLSRAGSWSARNHKAGFVPTSMLARFSSDPVQASEELCRRGLWRRVRGGFQFTDWESWAELLEQGTAPRKTTAGARRQALYRNPELKQAVRDRDRDKCRYCAARVRWGSGRARDSATYDYVLPDGPVEPGNVVVACLGCNMAKDGRTPDEAGMKLLEPPEEPPPKRYAEASPSVTRNASRNAYMTTDREIDLNQSLSVSQSADRNAGAREPQPGTPEFRSKVCGAFTRRTGVKIDDATADSIAAEVLGLATDPVPHNLNYVLKAVRQDADPCGRWLPKPEPQPEREPRPQRQPWCGECDEIDRAVYDNEGCVSRCPRCGGAPAAWENAS